MDWVETKKQLPECWMGHVLVWDAVNSDFLFLPSHVVLRWPEWLTYWMLPETPVEMETEND